MKGGGEGRRGETGGGVGGGGGGGGRTKPEEDTMAGIEGDQGSPVCVGWHLDRDLKGEEELAEGDWWGKPRVPGRNSTATRGWCV